MKKATNDQLIESYSRLKSVWKVAKEFGMCGQSVHERLQKIGIIQSHKFSNDELQKIKDFYDRGFKSGSGELERFCESINRERSTVCQKAKQLGLTSVNRKKSDNLIEMISLDRRRWHSENPHPKGMLGKTHSKDYCERRRKLMKEIPKTEHQRRTLKGMKTKLQRYGKVFPHFENSKVTWKQGWREIGGKRCYFRSRWEANFARYLESQKLNGEIKEWLHEPQTFWFEGIKRGSVSYLPDFKIIHLDDSHEWVEVKGWMDQRSKTKIKRFKKYFPNERFKLIDAKWYNKNSPILSAIIKDWEN